MENPGFIPDLDFMSEVTQEQIIEFLRGESLSDLSHEIQPINNITQAAQDPEFFFGDDMIIGGLILEDEVVNPVEPSMVGNGGPDQYLPIFSDKWDEEEQEEKEEENSSGTVANSANRSRTLVAERNRRGRMKEKLYALRALVPNITKMDKASIVGDAVMYMENLQRQAKKLKAEIQDLESSQRSQYHITQNPASKMNKRENFISKDHHEFYSKPANLMKILQMEVFQVEEKGFYIRVVCGKGDGVAVTLFKALESLPRFHVQSSNFSPTQKT